MAGLVCSRCGYVTTEEDNEENITYMFNKITGKDIILCPKCTYLFNYLVDMFLNMETKMEASEVN